VNSFKAPDKEQWLTGVGIRKALRSAVATENQKAKIQEKALDKTGDHRKETNHKE
jgi:hypothetical protein